ncbi:MAG TPA: SHOCT domain-containing protein [Patescibacteria group bacterium]
MMRYWNYGPGYTLNPGFSILGFIFQVLFWGLIIMLIVKLVRSSRCHHYEDTKEAGGDRSLEIIKERYAKGEIDKKEFEQLKKDLS